MQHARSALIWLYTVIMGFLKPSDVFCRGCYVMCNMMFQAQKAIEMQKSHSAAYKQSNLTVTLQGAGLGPDVRL